MNKYTQIANALNTRQNEIIQAYNADPKLRTDEGVTKILIYQIDLLMEALHTTLKELGTKNA